MVDLTKCAHYPNWEQKQDMALGEEFPSKKSQPRRGGAEVEGLERRNRKSSLRKRRRSEEGGREKGASIIRADARWIGKEEERESVTLSAS